MICTECKKYTDARAFAKFKNRTGKICRRGICQECRGKRAFENFEYLKKWRKDYNVKNRTKREIQQAERRLIAKTIIDDIKSKTPCMDCHRKFPATAMDFDHVRGKNRAISALVSGAYKLALILEEIKLCDIVCACCHRIRTAARKQNHAPNKRQKNLTIVARG